ncbi:protein serine/threonine phosphatase 2C [Cylindrobasidium torrendii FP15055 ss-10]|uniref:protein-serine/threonine phosphatase n=1 Tax=Cylindrobasidium torrendii FP15055 ss-10 TaxID=1314674 RepID=A0A0D7BVP6_9AGAR|nr:protein serine/threonine phosphatase 2C [Cylindrobasidium torrendii FP15055 ss-10]
MCSKQLTIATLEELDFSDAAPYQVLSLPELDERLALLSSARSVWGVDAASIQPCTNPAESSQDRYAIEEWTIGNSTWKFMSVFDGHAGHELVDYTVHHFPSVLRNALGELPAAGCSAEAVSELLVKTTTAFDDALKDDLLAILPDPQILASMSDDQIRAIINDGGKNSQAVLRCMRGTTLLVSLLRDEKDLWVANLGDCSAILGSKSSENKEGWHVDVLSFAHNAAVADEADRVRREHPGEPECILKDRVLGSIAVSRALGDHTFKLPRVYTDRVFLNSVPGYRIHSSVQEFSPRNLTPPYVSNVPQVRHVVLDGTNEHRLILCSDGLPEFFCREPKDVDIAAVGRALLKAITDGQGSTVDKGNEALRILRFVMRADDAEQFSQWLNLEYDGHWMDDTTALVLRFGHA